MNSSQGGARDIAIVPRVAVVSVSGLKPPPGPSVHPFFWHEDGYGRPPDVCRWIWDPRTGDMRIGTRFHHYMLLPGGRPRDILPWVRGFLLRCLRDRPGELALAVRPFFWPLGDVGEWNDGHAALNRRILEVLVPLLAEESDGAPVFTDVDDAWLQARTGRYMW